MPRTNVDAHFEEECKDLDFRAEYALLDLAEVIATQIKNIRENKGLSQKALADLLGTKQSQVSRLEDPFYGRYSLITLAKVADVLGAELKVQIEPRLVFKHHTGFYASSDLGCPSSSGAVSNEVRIAPKGAAA